jgi:hypothetical protein
MVRKGLGIFALTLFCLIPSFSAAQTTTVVPANFVLLAPPEFAGNPVTGPVPTRHWIYVGSYATQADCDNAKASMRYAISDSSGKVTRLPLPAASTCLSEADVEILN